MDNYEFNEKQNGIFKLLQMRMRFVGYTFIIVGILAALILIMAKVEFITFSPKYNIVGTILSVFFIITGILLCKAANAFKKIITTQGKDIEILMDAIKDLYMAYEIQMWMILMSVFFLIMASIFLREFSFIYGR